MSADVQERAYQEFLYQLRRGGLETGVVYTRSQLAQRLELTEASAGVLLRRLDAENYVDRLPGRGFCLHELSRRDAVETLQALGAAEQFFAQWIFPGLSSEKREGLLRDLEGSVQLMQENLRDPEAFSDYDYGFHLYLLCSADNRQFYTLLHRNKRNLEQLCARMLPDPASRGHAVKQYRRLLSSLCGKTAEPGLSPLTEALSAVPSFFPQES